MRGSVVELTEWDARCRHHAAGMGWCCTTFAVGRSRSSGGCRGRKRVPIIVLEFKGKIRRQGGGGGAGYGFFAVSKLSCNVSCRHPQTFGAGEIEGRGAAHADGVQERGII